MPPGRSWLVADRSARPARPLVPVLVLILAAPGCMEPLGPPERFPTTTVGGMVLEAGRPVGGGWVELIPVEGTVGDQRSAELAPDGSFRAERVSVGEVAVRLVNAPIRMLQAARVFAQFSTPIRRRTSAVSSDPIRIELMDELLQFQASQPRRPKLDPALEIAAPEPAGSVAP